MALRGRCTASRGRRAWSPARTTRRPARARLAAHHQPVPSPQLADDSL